MPGMILQAPLLWYSAGVCHKILKQPKTKNWRDPATPGDLIIPGIVTGEFAHGDRWNVP